MNDPTYNKEEIDKNPVWKRAFQISEIHNDSAPLGWGKYIPEAEAEIAFIKARGGTEAKKEQSDGSVIRREGDHYV